MKQIKNKSFVYILPLLDIQDIKIYKRLKSCNVYNNYDKDSDDKFKNRIFLTFKDYDLDFLEKIKTIEGYIKNEFIDSLLKVSFIIPEKFRSDVRFITLSKYTYTSRDYKIKIFSFWKNTKVETELQKSLTPTKEQIEEFSRNYIVDKELVTQLGERFDLLEETFHISNFIN